MAYRAAYNTRPVRGSGGVNYRRGKKENIFIRLLKYVFPIKGDGLFEAARKVVFLGAFVCVIYFGGSVVFDVVNEYLQSNNVDNFVREYFDNDGTLEIPDEVLEEVQNVVPTILPEYVMAYHHNPDLVGHIKIGNINLPESAPDKYIINYPVYQSDDNEFYLEHAFDKSYNKGGAIFADYRNRFDDGAISANTVLYGHNSYSQKYFTLLTRYYLGLDTQPRSSDELDFYKSHPLISFDTIYEKSTWKVFACAFFNTEEEYGEVFDYTNSLEFPNKEAFNTYILDLMDRSVLFTDVDIDYGDQILTLSTCYYPFGDGIQTRCVVFARKVRDGESPEVDTSKATFNTKEYRFERQANSYGTEWNGRIWDTSYLLSLT